MHTFRFPYCSKFCLCFLSQIPTLESLLTADSSISFRMIDEDEGGEAVLSIPERLSTLGGQTQVNFFCSPWLSAEVSPAAVEGLSTYINLRWTAIDCCSTVGKPKYTIGTVCSRI